MCFESSKGASDEPGHIIRLKRGREKAFADRCMGYHSYSERLAAGTVFRWKR